MKKILYVATVVKTHIMLFHIPYLKMLKETGWETAVAARNDYEDPEDCRIPYCDTYYDLPFERSPFNLQNVKTYKMLKKIIEEGDYDIVHCHTPMGSVLARVAARKMRSRGCRVIYTAHGFHFFKGAPLKNWLFYYPVERFLSRWTDILILINHEDYQRAEKSFHAKKTVYIPGIGVPAEKFADCRISKPEKCRELGIPENKFILLSVGELDKRKNQEVVIKALHKLDNPDVYYLIAGMGKKEMEYRHLIQKYSLENNVKLLGFREDIPELCRIADCFVHPSKREGLGIAPLEAMSCGLPLITSNVNGINDYAEDGISGCSVSPDSASQMARAIDKMLKDQRFRETCGKNNRETVKSFDISKSLDIMREIYSKEQAEI